MLGYGEIAVARISDGSKNGKKVEVATRPVCRGRTWGVSAPRLAAFGEVADFMAGREAWRFVGKEGQYFRKHQTWDEPKCTIQLSVLPGSKSNCGNITYTMEFMV